MKNALNYQKLISIFIICIIIVAASWSLLHPQLFFIHDYIHAARIIEMFRALEDGQFPVRWSQNFGYGYGMPLFEFYAPLPYYTGALLKFFELPMAQIIKILYVLASAIAAYGAYRLGREYFKSTAAGLVVSAAFTLSSYRAVNLFVRGALSEAWAMAFLPLILLFGIRIINRDTRYWKFLTLSLAALILSHNITAMIFIPASGLFLLLLHLYEHQANKQKLFKTIIRPEFLLIIGSYIFAVLLSAFYWLPALAEKGETILDSAILTGYFDYHLHFIYIRQLLQPAFKYGGSEWGPEDGISFFLGWGQLLSFGIILIFGFLYLWKNRGRLKQFILSRRIFKLALIGLFAAIALYMSLLRAEPIWNLSPIFYFIQFPWRFLSVSTVFVSLLAGGAVYLAPNRKLRAVTATILLIGIITTSFSYFQPERYLDDSDSLYYTEPARIRKEMSGILPDYIPLNLNTELAPAEEAYLENPNYTVDLVLDRSHEKIAQVTAAQDELFVFAVADYPGWKVYLNGSETDKIVTGDGLIAAFVPKGSHEIAIKLTATKVRAAADFVSAISLVALLIFIMREHQRSRHEV